MFEVIFYGQKCVETSPYFGLVHCVVLTVNWQLAHMGQGKSSHVPYREYQNSRFEVKRACCKERKVEDQRTTTNINLALVLLSTPMKTPTTTSFPNDSSFFVQAQAILAQQDSWH